VPGWHHPPPCLKTYEYQLTMARRKHIVGTCHICGDHTKLSFEHIPPRAAFNDRPILQANVDDIIKKQVDIDLARAKIEQRGAGGYTLCERCNSDTGAWYGSPFVDWSYQLMRVLYYSRGEPTLYYLYRIFPLRVIKQIICMFFSTNGDKFREVHPNLLRFILNKEAQHLGPDMKIYCFFNPTGRSRNTGVAGVLDINRHTSKIISEIVFPPMGYVMSFNQIKPDERLFDISFFSEYRYNDWKELSLKLPVLPIYTFLPGDYRSKREVRGK
jgi:hypothetical protein